MRLAVTLTNIFAVEIAGTLGVSRATEWSVRDLVIEDAEGNQLSFGCNREWTGRGARVNRR